MGGGRHVGSPRGGTGGVTSRDQLGGGSYLQETGLKTRLMDRSRPDNRHEIILQLPQFLQFSVSRHLVPETFDSETANYCEILDQITCTYTNNSVIFYLAINCLTLHENCEKNIRFSEHFMQFLFQKENTFNGANMSP